MAVQDHAVPQIEPVGVVPREAGIELQATATEFSAVLDEPGEERLAAAAPLGCGGGDEVIDVKKAAPNQVVDDPKAGNAAHGAGLFQVGKPVALVVLLPDAVDEGRFVKMRAQLPHHREAARDDGIFRGDGDRPVQRGASVLGSGGAAAPLSTSS